MNEIARILSATSHGDDNAAAALLPLVYEELRKLAAQRLAHEKPGQTLQGTALVHEAYLRLVGSEDTGLQHFSGRGHFFAAAAEAMRRILVDAARRKLRPKHGGGRVREGDEQDLAAPQRPEALLALDEALGRLAAAITATAGSDYTAASATVTIPAGQTSRTLTVAVKGDRLGEPSETFSVNLSAPTNATIGGGQGVGTILDDEPRISIGDVSGLEGRKGRSTLLTFTVTLSAAYDQPVTTSFRTNDGAARSGTRDYIARSGTITFNPGETSKTVTVEVLGDNNRENNETFYVDLLGNSANSVFARSRGIGTILNDD
jgi:RNA polymerase sigma factor (TIGR02999 family)